MSLYGTTVDADDIHSRVTAFIEKWAPSYIAEMGARKGFSRAEIPVFASYTNVEEMDKWPEDQLPAVVTFIPGTDSEPYMEGTGAYTAEWPVGIGVIASSLDRTATRKLLTAYLLAIRAMFIQHGSIDGLAESTTWMGESYDELSFDSARTIQAGIVSFRIKINNVIDSRSGLSFPPEDPVVDPGDYELVELAEVEVKELD
jgi:hypothetical protein